MDAAAEDADLRSFQSTHLRDLFCRVSGSFTLRAVICPAHTLVNAGLRGLERGIVTMFPLCPRAMLLISFAAVLAFSVAACNATPSQEESAKNTQMSEDHAPLQEPTDTTLPATEPLTSVSSGSVAPVDPEHSPLGTSAIRCDAARAQPTIGNAATQDVIDRAAADSTSDTVRVIKPGDAVTDDFSEGRLNLEVDASNTIIRANCG